MHRYGALGADLVSIALSPFLALMIRDNFVLYLPHWEAITAYATISFIVCLTVFVIGGSHKSLWQATSLPDVLRIVAVVTAALLIAVTISFVASRLEGVARSVPVIQWLILIGAMTGTRLAFRLWHDRARLGRPEGIAAPIEHVLIVGAGPLTELYVRAVAEYGCRVVSVVGILSNRIDFGGRRLRQQEILGTPEELVQMIDRLEVHGITVERVAVTQLLEELSPRAVEALLALERGSNVKVDWIVERLGLRPTPAFQEHRTRVSDAGLTSPRVGERESLSLGKYGYVKRGFDVLAALVLSVGLAPLILVVALLVWLDVGFPLVFWQQRPGRFGRPFKLFKFRTMRLAHDALGRRVPDEQRSSKFGHLLRRTRLDELPQLYNILIGEMSFVGPRPLLPMDQPRGISARLSVRPGLTGFAQVHGGRTISIEDKNTLDTWYILNASLWLDITVLLRTATVLIKGERLDHDTLGAARQELARLKAQGTPNPDPSSLVFEGVVGEGKVRGIYTAG